MNSNEIILDDLNAMPDPDAARRVRAWYQRTLDVRAPDPAVVTLPDEAHDDE